MSTQLGNTAQNLNLCIMNPQIQAQTDSGNLLSPKKEKKKSVNFFQLFRFADKLDYFLMTVGIICALVAGGSVSIFSLLWGDIIDNFKSKDELVNQTYNTMLKFVYIGLGILVLGAIMIYSWVVTGERQSNRCKKLYLQSLFSQEIGWFETGNQFEISSDFSVNCAAFQSAIGHNIPFIFNVIGIGISGIVIALCKGWLMTIVTFISIPLMILAKYTYSRLLINKQKIEQESYSQAGGRAQEGLFAIKTVKMLNGEQFQSNKYLTSLIKSKRGVYMNALLFSLSVGSSLFLALCTFAFGLWYGSHCIRNTSSCPKDVAKQSYTAGAVFTVYFGISTISFYMSHLPYNIKKVSVGLAAASKIFQIIDRQPKIKNPTFGIKIKDFKGLIKFNNVSFSYPKDPSRKILDRLNLQINKNKIALVGTSGCGKSTIIQLLLRFYDPCEGNITVDGIDLRSIDLQWWREEIVGYVGQEPFLFAATIRENLLFSRPNATQAEIEAALKKAEVYDFIHQLEKGLDTYAGSGGCQVSGGQKQRIAIARAFLKNPKILILDQATSALDRKTQKSIQRTLNKVTQGIISITIAHRVKTIQNSDEIFVIENGQVKQNGKFLELKTFSGMKIQHQARQTEQNKEENKQQLKVTRFQQKVKDQKKVQNILRRLLKFLQGSYLLIIISLSCSIVIGSAFPVSTIFLSKLTAEMLIPNNSELETLSNRYSFIVLLIAIAGFLGYLIHINIIQRVNVRVTTNIRLQIYKKLLKLPIYWHEREQNNVNAVSSKLAVGSYHISEIISTSFFALIDIICCLLTGLIIGFIFQWRTALVQLAFLPIQIATAGFTAKYRNGEVSAQKQQSSLGGKINEAVTNIRTVYSLGYQKKLTQKYSEILQRPYESNKKRAAISGLFYGMGQCLIFVSISILYHIGSRFMRDYDLKAQDVFIVIFSNFFATITLGEMSTILPNFQKCIQSMKGILMIEDEKDEDQLQIQEKSKMISDGKIDGDIMLRNISFKYESRSIHLFENFNLTIPYGKKVGFVGVSGCGKSTIISFLLRFYIPQQGEIYINNINIKDYDIHYLRSQFGVVGQEPVVFDASFKENIIYNMNDVSEKEIINVARKANALSFIVDPLRIKAPLQEQYDFEEELVENNRTGIKDMKIFIYKSIDFSQFERKVGVKGSSISGGQKQRVAIARALLRKPKILLLDQATSALDSVNEKIVTQCLNSIMEDRTIISIAHRLETLKAYNIINVFDKGTVVQSGTYDQLLQRKGYFYNLEKGYEML